MCRVVITFRLCRSIFLRCPKATCMTLRRSFWSTLNSSGFSLVKSMVIRADMTCSIKETSVNNSNTVYHTWAQLYRGSGEEHGRRDVEVDDRRGVQLEDHRQYAVRLGPRGSHKPVSMLR